MDKDSTAMPTTSNGETLALLLQERLNNRILDVRAAGKGAIFKLHSGMCELAIEFMGSHGFHWIHTPRLIQNAIDGDNEFFSLSYFGSTGYLAQSTQFHKQMAISMGMGQVYEIGPLFRAEKKLSSRHLTEFTGLDFEMQIDQGYHELIDFAASLINHIIHELQHSEKYRNALQIAKRMHSSAGMIRVSRGKVERISFGEAKELLRSQGGMTAVSDQENLTAEEEALLGRLIRETRGTDLFVVDGYPSHTRGFYSAGHPSKPGTANAFDFILRGQEIVSGSQHIHEHAAVCASMRAHDPPLDPEAVIWRDYVDAFRLGMPKHGGCGIGLNRLLQSFLALDDIREATLFPRDSTRLAP